MTVWGCRQVWDRASGLEPAVRDLLARAVASDTPLDCRMIGTSRTGACEAFIQGDTVERLIEQLKLTQVFPDQPEDYEYQRWSDGGTDSCAAKYSGPDMKIYKSKRRTPELRLEDGAAFEYFLLFYNPGAKAACIQVSFAYG